VKRKITNNTVLIVDDQIIIALSLKVTLEELGFKNISICGTGEEAIRLSRIIKPDIIIMDIMLGSGINGYEASKIIKKELGSKVLFLSGYPEINIISEIILNNPNSLILKPHNIREVEDKITLLFNKGKKWIR